MLTIHSDTADSSRASRSGADDYVRKPYADAELAARVAALVRSSQLRLRLEASERAVRSLLIALPDALITLDAAHVISFANAEAERMLGAAPGALIGRQVTAVIATLFAGDARPRRARRSGPPPGCHRGRSDLLADRSAPPGRRNDRHGDCLSRRHLEAERRVAPPRFYSIIAHDLRAPLNAISMRAHLMAKADAGAIAGHTAKMTRT